MNTFVDLPFPSVLVNEKYESIAANKAAQELLDIEISTPVFTADHQDILSTIQRAFSGEACEPLEFTFSESTFLLYFKLIKAEKTPCVLITFHDISAYKKQAAGQMDIMHCLAHELKAPIGAISGYLDLILEGLAGSPEKEKEMMQKARDRAEGLLEFISEVLQYAKAGKEPSCPIDEAIDISQILQNTIELFTVESQKKEHQFESRIAPAVFVIANKLEISRIFTNLISNAIKYTPEKGSVTISLEKDKNHAVLTVSDTGIGIPENELDKLFTEFHRASNAVHSTIPGTGLGMAITKKLIEKYDGNISVASRENEGTTFTVRLVCENEN